MATRKRGSHRDRARRPASTVEAKESQVISMAVDLAEQQILDGTVSAQVLTYYLKLGSAREKLELQRLERENELLKSKVEQLASAKNVEELYGKALAAMRAYSGQIEDEDDVF